MIESLRDHAEGSVLDADLCIVGAGAAGIAIARELRDSGLRVLVAESGGLQLETDTQALYHAEVAGPLDYAAAATRMRFFGGSTNCWTGYCAPLDPLDLEVRDWVPHSGWPLTRAELDPFYARAQSLLELGPFFYDGDALSGAAGPLRAFLPERLRNTLWQHSQPPTRFGTRYRAELEAATRVRVLLHANTTRIETDAARAQVTGVRVQTLEGRHATLRARAFVLATGGIENPRLLLLSDGLGNRHDLVGRFFMEHVVTPAAWIAPRATSPAAPGPWMDHYDGLTLRAGTPASAAVGPSLAAQRAEGLLNAVATFTPGRTRLDAGYLALARLRRSLGQGELPDDFAREVCRVLVDIDDVAEGLRARLRDEPYTAFEGTTNGRVLNVHVEQAPNPDSRVSLADERDALGQRRARLDWRLGAAERATIRATARLLGDELGRLGLGRLRQDDWLDDEDSDWPIVAVKCHHMGTTRMSRQPQDGVVDPDGRVHGVANLYVAGSSVFPTCGYANPTLTLVALALRLADHLRGRLA